MEKKVFRIWLESQTPVDIWGTKAERHSDGTVRVLDEDKEVARFYNIQGLAERRYTLRSFDLPTDAELS